MAYPIRVVWSASKTEEPSLKVLMSAPKKKLKHAVDRNRVKRLLREAYRLQKKPLTDLVAEYGLQVQMAFIWIPNEVLDYPKVERKVADALTKIQQLVLPVSLEENVLKNDLDCH